MYSYSSLPLHLSHTNMGSCYSVLLFKVICNHTFLHYLKIMEQSKIEQPHKTKNKQTYFFTFFFIFPP